jgi:hypothetical protein
MRRSFDPLSFIPSPEAVRHHLAEAELRVKQLRVVLQVAERVSKAGDKKVRPPRRKAVLCDS